MTLPEFSLTLAPFSAPYIGSRGRIGCTGEQALVLENTHQEDYQKVLERLAALPYVERIAESHFE